METTPTHTYASPLDQLLTLGDGYTQDRPDYASMGFGPEHVPELVRMATDLELMELESEDGWAPIHAIRVIGAIRAADAVEPLLAMFEKLDALDYSFDETTDAFGNIGPAALPPLVRYFEDDRHDSFARTKASEALVHIAQRFPETREEIVAVLARPLEDPECRDDELNGFLVCDLLDLDAVEAVPAIERAYVEDRVDITIPGDWEDVQVKLGLIPERLTPRPDYNIFGGMPYRFTMPIVDSPRRSHRASKNASMAKARRKAEKAARRKNRRRK
jgi:HEAT repeat protein